MRSHRKVQAGGKLYLTIGLSYCGWPQFRYTKEVLDDWDNSASFRLNRASLNLIVKRIRVGAVFTLACIFGLRGRDGWLQYRADP